MEILEYYSSLPRTSSLTADERCGEAGVFACLSSYSYHISLSFFTSSFPRLGFVLIYLSCVRVNSEHLLSNNFPLFSHPIRLLFVTFQVVAINIRTMTLFLCFLRAWYFAPELPPPLLYSFPYTSWTSIPAVNHPSLDISIITAWLLPFSFSFAFLKKVFGVLYCTV